MEPPLLDQVSSQALTRLAAERVLRAEVPPVGEEAVQVRKRGWTRWLPYLFFALSIFAVGSMAFSVTSLADGGWSFSDVCQLILMGILVAGVFTQARGMLRASPAGRWLTNKRSVSADETPRAATPAVPALDVVSAEYLTALQPAAARPVRRRAAVRRAGSRAFERIAVAAVVILGVLAFLGMLFLVGYIAYTASPWDPAMWLTAPFTALTGFAACQLFRQARRSAFRGRPWNLVARAFRDSIRVWGSGSLVSKVALTTTATASVAGAAVVPAIAGPSIPVDLFVVDSTVNSLYRIDLDTLASVRFTGAATGAKPIGFTSTSAPSPLPNGKTLPTGSLMTVVEAADGTTQSVFALRPGSKTPIPIGQVTPVIPGASFAGGLGALYAVQPDGAFWTVDPKTGAANRVGQLTITPGPMTYDPGAKVILMLSGGTLSRIDPVTRSVIGSKTLTLPNATSACGIARGPSDRLFVAEAGTGALFVVRLSQRTIKPIPITGETPEGGCLITAAKRR